MFWLERGPLNVNTRNVVWLCRPKMEFMNIIAGELNDVIYLLVFDICAFRSLTQSKYGLNNRTLQPQDL